MTTPCDLEVNSDVGGSSHVVDEAEQMGQQVITEQKIQRDDPRGTSSSHIALPPCTKSPRFWIPAEVLYRRDRITTESVSYSSKNNKKIKN